MSWSRSALRKTNQNLGGRVRRWALFFELLLMVSIGSLMLFAFVIAISWAMNGQAPSSYEKLWDMLKFVGGPLLGAGIAFYVNDRVHRERKAESELTAVLGAAFSISRMYGDLVHYRWAVRTSLDVRYSELGRNPQAHPVSLLRPHMFTFGDNDYPNLSTLHFLLHEESGRLAFVHIQSLVRQQSDLVYLHNELNEYLIDIQKVVNDDGEGPNDRLLAGAEAVMRALVTHLEGDEELFENVREALKQAAISYFRSDRDIRLNRYILPGPEFLAANLPPWPPQLEPAEAA